MILTALDDFIDNVPAVSITAVLVEIQKLNREINQLRNEMHQVQRFLQEVHRDTYMHERERQRDYFDSASYTMRAMDYDQHRRITGITGS